MEDGGSGLLSIGFCVLFTAFTSAAETALTALGEARSRQLVEEQGHRSLKLWIDQPERVLATLLVSSTITTTLAAALMTALIDQLQAERAVALATVLVTVLILIFSEITPKTLARRYATVVGPATMPIITAVYYLLYPVTAILLAIPQALNRLLSKKGEAREEAPPITSEEIEYMIDLGAREGVFDREKSALLTSVLDFADTMTREIMVPRLKITAIPEDADRAQVIKIVLESQHSRIPVYRDSIDDIVGVLYVKNILTELEKPGGSSTLDLKVHMKPPFFVPELMKISRLLREFQKRKVHLAVVVDEFGGTAGVVALEDVVEEIVGEIQDEQDVEEGRLKVLSDGTVIADASLTLRDLEETLKVNFPDELDYDSLGGFVTATAGRVPPVGSVILWRDLRFTVRAGDERRVTRVEIVKVPDPKSEPPPVA
jgi:CBS domain containing-hemolysin-like protein